MSNRVAVEYQDTHHVADIGVGVVDHGIFERPQEVLLELEVCELFLLQEAHGQLTKSVQGEEPDVRVLVATHLQTNYEPGCNLGTHFATYLVEVFP